MHRKCKLRENDENEKLRENDENEKIDLLKRRRSSETDKRDRYCNAPDTLNAITFKEYVYALTLS